MIFFFFNHSSTLINYKSKAVGEENQIIDGKEGDQYSGFFICEFTTNLIRKFWSAVVSSLFYQWP